MVDAEFIPEAVLLFTANDWVLVAELAFIATEFVPEEVLILVANDCWPVACPFIKAIAPWPVSAIAPCPIATLSVDLAVPCIETELDPEAVPSKDIEPIPEAVPDNAIELDPDAVPVNAIELVPEAVPFIATELYPDAVPETNAIELDPEANVPFIPWANELTPPAVASPPEWEFSPFA